MVHEHFNLTECMLGVDIHLSTFYEERLVPFVIVKWQLAILIVYMCTHTYTYGEGSVTLLCGNTPLTILLLATSFI